MTGQGVSAVLPDNALDGPRTLDTAMRDMNDRYLLNELLLAHGARTVLRTIANQWSERFDELNLEHQRRNDERRGIEATS